MTGSNSRLWIQCQVEVGDRLRLDALGCIHDNASADPPPQWDIPARMATATAFVLLLTELAPALGPYLTGLLAPFPLYATILAAFAHHLQGPSPAIGVLRGLLLGLFAFASFFLVLAALIEPVGIALAFGAATLVALMLQGGSFWVLQRVWK